MARSNKHALAGYAIGGVHKRIRRIRGRSKSYKCVDCGNQACDWSWIHNTDPLDIFNYEPRCKSCHQKYDRFGFLPGHSKNKGTTAWINRRRDALGRFTS